MRSEAIWVRLEVTEAQLLTIQQKDLVLFHDLSRDEIFEIGMKFCPNF